ncbi:MFS transporter [Streptomyces sp. NBC_01754]|uniref:MFS transporter n=1 Tax=Streptomyces sp. NBC_01754 TaxID=2975930 RepID=UPI002DD8BCDB|nr:MFS transporter [Streptomyces sp. NBC_01754]WSC95045.1 MFS transporter [Streptomyces sp. NBC_01754]
MADTTGLENHTSDLGDTTPRPGRVLTVASLAYGMIVIDISIVHIAIPAIRADLHASLPTMQLVINAYTIVLASLLLAGSGAVGRFGAVPMFRLGVAVFGVTSLLCGIAPDGGVLVVMRASQGLGAVLVVPATLVMLTDTYKDPDGRAKAISIWAMAAGSPVAFAPLFGGALVEAAGWRSIFLINVPVVLVVLWLSARHMPQKGRGARGEPQDMVGQLLAIVFLGCVALTLAEGQDLGWTRPLPVVTSVTALVALAAFVVRQRRYAFPMIPGDLFRAPGFRGFVTVGLLLFAGYYGLVFSLSVYLQQVRGYDPVTTALCFLPSALPITFMPLVAGRVNAGFGARRVLGVATALSLAGGATLFLIGGHAPVGTGIGLAFVGLGFGLATVPQITLVMETAPPHRAALAGGLMSVGRQAGSLIGVALIGGLHSGDGIAAPALTVVVIYLLMALAAGLGRRRPAARTA